MNVELEDQKSIDDLPIEVLEKVFLALDAKSVKNCCLVNKKWNAIIDQNSSVMEKLPLLLHQNEKNSWSDIYQATKNFRRKFRTIHIKFEVTHLYWDEYATKTLRKFVSECYRIQHTTDWISGILFKILESVRTKSAKAKFASQMLEVLRSSHVQLSHLSLDVSYENGSGFSELITFLCTQTKLATLCSTFGDQDFSFGLKLECMSDIERIQLPLRTLALINEKPVENPEMLVAFVSRFTKTLEDFTCFLNCDSIHKMIFTKLNKLSSIAINADYAPQEISFYHELRPNYFVKKLVIDETSDMQYPKKEIIKGFIGLLPNVETLELNLWTIPNDALMIVSNHLKHLATLKFMKCLDSKIVSSFACVHLPSVKTIIFGAILGFGQEEWKLIVDALPNIESMSVNAFLDSKSLSCRSTTLIAKSWPNLVSLKFGRGFVARYPIFTELLRNCKNITIELLESSFKSKQYKDKIFKRVKKHGLHLIVDESH